MLGCIFRCLEYVESKDLGKPVAFLAKMTGYPRLVIQLLRDGLLDPNRVKKLLDGCSPREVVLDMLMIVSDLARMSKVGGLIRLFHACLTFCFQPVNLTCRIHIMFSCFAKFYCFSHHVTLRKTSGTQKWLTDFYRGISLCRC